MEHHPHFEFVNETDDVVLGVHGYNPAAGGPAARVYGPRPRQNQMGYIMNKVERDTTFYLRKMETMKKVGSAANAVRILQ